MLIKTTRRQTALRKVYFFCAAGRYIGVIICLEIASFLHATSGLARRASVKYTGGSCVVRLQLL